LRDGKAMMSKADNERRGLGRNVLAFDDDDVVHLLRAAIKREGSQVAFAKRYGVNRSYLNLVLSGKRSISQTVTKALGLRRVYIAE
jgi:hypothetical protein